MKTGIELISAERQRQIEKEGYDADHDSLHESYELAMAAACYCAPAKIYVMSDSFVNRIEFVDPFPFEDRMDKRYQYGGIDNGNRLPDPETYTEKERLDLLVKAGALIAAQIDVILNKEK